MMTSLTIIDTGCANISSVKYAFERLGIKPLVSADPKAIQAADRVLLPGVGSAGAAMASIDKRSLAPVIKGLQQPVLGICLGMQLLTSQSNELTKQQSAQQPSNSIPCLDLIPTEISRLNADDLVLPHMGWNQVKPKTGHALFRGIAPGSYFYFVHSFRAPVSEFTAATCQYGETFSASISKDNFYGVQFHPERSGEAGMQLLKNFMEII